MWTALSTSKTAQIVAGVSVLAIAIGSYFMFGKSKDLTVKK